MKTRTLTIVSVIIAALSTASLLAGLRHALRRERHEPALDPHEAERRRVREALGDLLAPPMDYSIWPEHLRPRPDLPDRDTLRRSIKPWPRPAWMDIREDRDGRG